jgi:DNA-binding MarR family transcriptional regulator
VGVARGDTYRNYFYDKKFQMSKEYRQELVASVAWEIAQFQDAGTLVDEAVAQHLGINRTDMRCLGLLSLHGPMGAGQLAAATELSPGAMTAALDRLERIGYVRRVRSLTDRRSVTVEITPEAFQQIQDFYGPIGEEGVSQLETYSDPTLLFLRDFLRKGREMQMRHAARIRSQRSASTAE